MGWSEVARIRCSLSWAPMHYAANGEKTAKSMSPFGGMQTLMARCPKLVSSVRPSNQNQTSMRSLSRIALGWQSEYERPRDPLRLMWAGV